MITIIPKGSYKVKIKLFSLVLAVIIASLSLASCSSLRGADDTSPSTEGVGRVTEPQGSDSLNVNAGTDVPPETDGESEETSEDTTADTAQTDKPVEIPSNGKLNIPTDLSFLDSIQKGHFVDKNPDDPNGCWYPGSIKRNLSTGEVTVAWDRNAATIELVEKYGAIYRGDDTQKYVYLTFDCGYEYITPEYPKGVTSDILDTLKEKGVTGTFFVTGDYLKGTKGEVELVGRMLDEGHIVGTHTMSHYNMTTLTPEKFVEEIKSNNDLFRSLFPDAPDMTFYRPPEGGANEWTLALAQKMGLTTVFWSATEADYNTANQPDPAKTLLNDKVKLHNGGVYLLHAVSTTNAQILGDLIDFILAEGYEIRPLDEFVR